MRVGGGRKKGMEGRDEEQREERRKVEESELREGGSM